VREAVECVERMNNAGHEMMPVDTNDERSALIDAFFESLKVREG
jgi:hypothetical protein